MRVINFLEREATRRIKWWIERLVRFEDFGLDDGKTTYLRIGLEQRPSASLDEIGLEEFEPEPRRETREEQLVWFLVSKIQV